MKKTLFSIGLLLSTPTLFSQTPTITINFGAVAGTSYKQVWDTTATQLKVPLSGSYQIWGYANQFTNVVDTFEIITSAPDSTTVPGSQGKGIKYMTLSRSPYANKDSIVDFYHINRNGLYSVGGYDAKVGQHVNITCLKKELIMPFELEFGQVENNTGASSVYLTYNGYEVKKVTAKSRKINALGYGTLITPLGKFKNVLLVREDIKETDSIYIKSGTNYSYDASLFPVENTVYSRYHFLCNNTFATTELMMLETDSARSTVKYGWYALPGDIGSISGTVKDSLGNAITSAEVKLYRMHSNFTQDDLLASTRLDTIGEYQFDTIPYGKYMIAIKPDTSSYPHAIVTYYGDKAKWKYASILYLTSDTTNIDIEVIERMPLNGKGRIGGNISIDRTIDSSNVVMKTSSADPSEGTHIIVTDSKGGIAIDGDSNVDGDFTFDNLTDGNYELFVDIPGLEMSNTYSFTISGTTMVSGLDFIIGEDSVYANSSAIITGIKTISTSENTNGLVAYPNPYKTVTTLKATMEQKGNMIIEVYNMVGKKVTTIMEDEKEQGEYNYTFSAKDLGFTNGLYFVKLTTPAKTITIKIIEE